MGPRNWMLSKNTALFDALDQHATIAVGAAEELRALLRSPQDLPLRVRRIHAAEQAADAVTHQLLARLHRAFMTSIDREHLHRLIGAMDDIIDFIEGAASRLAAYEIRVMTAGIMELGDALAAATEDMRQAVRDLRNKRAVGAVRAACVRINDDARAVDRIVRLAVARLFRSKTDPIAVMKWKELYETLATAIERCERVAHVLEGIVLERE